MILRSICVEGWRCFAGSVEVGPFSDGLNIVYGPNGVGKSTMMMSATTRYLPLLMRRTLYPVDVAERRFGGVHPESHQEQDHTRSQLRLILKAAMGPVRRLISSGPSQEL